MFNRKHCNVNFKRRFQNETIEMWSVSDVRQYSGLSLSRTPSISNFSLSWTILSVPFHWFKPNFLSLSRTFSISNKFLGPLRVRDRESPLYTYRGQEMRHYDWISLLYGGAAAKCMLLGAIVSRAVAISSKSNSFLVFLASGSKTFWGVDTNGLFFFPLMQSHHD